ncbi:MAG: hypothetical protein LQ343_006695 [Gyalolechia ehrenbergii]|nr:MAG: hypothetical protein LQ343_006695 [Gyalolechia ehrenbergii]
MGFFGFMYRQKTAHPAPVPFHDLTGQTILVTGANVGIGMEATRQLIGFKVARVIMAVRTPAKGEEAKRDLLKTNPSCDIQIWPLDMDDFNSVLAFNRRAQELDRLDIALLNAGVKKQDYEQNSTTGHETTIQVNHLATSLLSLLLLPPLRQTAARFGKPSRLTFTASEVHMWTQFKEKTAPHIIKELDDKNTWANPDRYNCSKLLNVLWCRELASRVSKDEIIINCVNPGLVRSSLHRENTNKTEQKFTAFFGWSTEEGGRTLVNAAVAQGPATHGAYISECKPTNASPWVRSEEGGQVQKKLFKQTIDTLQEDTHTSLSSYL